jgi:PAS domain S-box-containing protein
MLSWNRAAQRTFGLSAADTIGRPASAVIPERRRPHDLRMIARAAAGERVAPFETSRLRKGGGEVDVLLAVATVRNAAGIPTGVCTIARDLTESARMRRELARANAAAEAANEELEAFAYSVAHDFRSFSRTIDAYSQVLARDCEDELGEGGRESLRVVRDASRSMARLTDDILVLTRAGRNALERTPIDLSALARAVAARLSRQDPERNVEIRIADGLVAECDSRLLMVVFDNLLGNAWKFTAGQELARVQVGAIERQGTRAYFVSDNGAGFDIGGLGLATVKRIVRRHGGRVWTEAAADAGATVYFTLGPAASVA